MARPKPSDAVQIRAAVRDYPHVSYSLAVAIADRESNCKNIVGDRGHGRGMFQLDDRYQRDFLATHRGCKSGSSVPIYKNALAKGRVPTVYAGATQMCRIIESNIAQAKRAGVPHGHRLRVAISGYNAGLQGALAGYRRGNSDVNTTGHDYAKDVFKRMGK